MLRGTGKDPELTALLIAPDRDLAGQLLSAAGGTRAFQVLSELKAYPAQQTLDLRLRQVQPDVVLLDVASDLEAASALVRHLSSAQPPVYVIALHHTKDSSAVIGILRAGAHEFLHAPFEAAAQLEAASRIRRMREPEAAAPLEFGKLVALSSAQPGSGASTLSTQTAFCLRKLTGKRVLLLDLDLWGGSIAFNLKINSPYSVLDALEHSDRLDPSVFSTLTTNVSGVDVLAAPESAGHEEIEVSRLHDVFEYARMLYDWVIIDLPSIFHRLSLFVLSESDQCLLVTTSELPSLHLARRAVGLLGQLGFGRERFQMVINRVNKKDGISAGDMEKILACPVFATFPNDYYALHRVVTRAEALPVESDLGRSLDLVASRIAGLVQKKDKTGSPVFETKPVLSQT